MNQSTKILDLVDTLDAIVWEADARTFAFSFVSRRAEAILGYPAARWVDEPSFWPDHVHPDDRDEAMRCCKTATLAGEDHTFEYRMIAADGRSVWLRDLVRVLCGADGQPERLRGVMIDITGEKEMQRALAASEASRRRGEETFRAIIEGGNDLVSVLDVEGIIRYASPSHQRLLGWAPEELVGRNAFEMVHPEDAAALATRFAEGIGVRDAIAEQEFRYRHRDGSWRTLEGRASSLREPTIRGAVINSRDVTQRHAAEAELRSRLEFEKLVVDISTTIANADPRSLDAALSGAVAKLGRHMGAQLAFIALNLRDESVCIAHEWNAPGFGPLAPGMQRVPPSSFAWWTKTLRNDGWAAIDSLEDLPTTALDERELCRGQNLVAGRAVLMVARGRPLGFIDCAFDATPERPLEEDLRLLRFVGEICANAIARQREENAKTALLALDRQLSGTLDLDLMLEQSQAIVAEHLGCKRVSVYYGEGESGGFVRLARFGAPSTGDDPGAASGVRPGHPIYALLERGEVAVADDPAEQPWFDVDDLAAFQVGPFLIAPLTIGGSLRGMICAARGPQARPFHEGEVEIFDGIARQISLAAQSAEIYREKQAEATVASALVRVGNELITTLDQSVLLERVTRLAAEVLDANVALTYLWSAKDKMFAPIAAHGESAERWEALRVLRFPGAMLGEFFARILAGEVFQADRSERIELLPERFVGPPDVQSIVYIPLHQAGETVGTLVVGRRDKVTRFTVEQLRTAQGLGQLASLALVNARVVEELERLSRLKSDFVATMSHELRTPLNVIMGYNDLLLDQAFGPLNEQQDEIIERIRQSAGELLELINATLDVSRLDTGRLPVERRRVRFRDLLSEIQSEMRQLRVKPGVGIEWEAGEDLPEIFTDPVKVKVVIKNLVGNALKFTESGCVRISARRLSDGVEIMVADTGIGIGAEAQAIIFEAFRQADSSATRRHGGVGLGLYIVRRLLDLLDGKVSLESEAGRGSTFRVWLPAQARSEALTSHDAA